jgi:hypothetical protein
VGHDSLDQEDLFNLVAIDCGIPSVNPNSDIRHRHRDYLTRNNFAVS